uniref:Uncharacterized protein n=1 Tax=Lepeophtheirus salmonis TaxID=72036 RepID=A0A0K2UNE1_LEPSM
MNGGDWHGLFSFTTPDPVWLFERALVPLQRLGLAYGVDGCPGDTQLLGVRE